MFEPLIDPKIVEDVDKVNQMVHNANIELYHLWLSSMVFKWHWWVDLALTILPWALWFLVRKKESTHRFLHGGLVVMLIAAYLDFLGLALGLWGYNSKLLPLIPPYFPWDFTLLPVTAMLFYQYKPQIHPFIKAICFSVLGSFIVQPIFQWLGFYNPKGWKHYYSFPFIVGIYLIGHYFTTRRNFEKI